MHMKDVYDVLRESLVYEHFSEDVHVLLLGSVEDDIGYVKLACATLNIADSRLLSCMGVRQRDWRPRLGSRARAHDGDVVIRASERTYL